MILTHLLCQLSPRFLFFALSSTLFYVGYWILRRKGKRYPPGPWMSLPIVGYLPFIQDKPHLKLAELTRKYGNVFGFYLGRRYCVVLGDVNSVRSNFNKDVYSGRPPQNNLHPDFFESGIGNMNGKHWLEQRKLIIHSLKGLSADGSLIDCYIKDEARHLLHEIEQSEGRPVDMQPLLLSATSNVICRLVFGERYDYDDAKRKFLDHAIQVQNVSTSQAGYNNYIHGLAEVPFVNRYLGLSHFRNVLRELRELVEKEIKEHERTFDPNHIRDYIDAFLLKIQNSKGDSSFTDDTLRGSLYTVLNAGAETVKTSLTWTLYTLAAKPEIQDKIQKELDNVIGRGREPLTEDMKLMPYTLSVLMEIQRYHTVVNVNIVRYTLDESKVNEYDIPKGTVILSNLWSMHHDEKYWKDPETFIPGRFLSDDGLSVKKIESYMPFSVGKRLCPGENLAYAEIFSFLVCILQKYEMRLPEGVDPDFESLEGISFNPKPHKLIFVPHA